MTANGKSTKQNLHGPDDAPELTAALAERAQVSVGGKLIREASGTVTKRGRPPVGDEPKQQVTLRLPRNVIAFFKAGGRGWQTRISEVLERQVDRNRRKSAYRRR
jgi:uncharacterized protein (DUF4415 family)